VADRYPARIFLLKTCIGSTLFISKSRSFLNINILQTYNLLKNKNIINTNVKKTDNFLTFKFYNYSIYFNILTNYTKLVLLNVHFEEKYTHICCVRLTLVCHTEFSFTIFNLLETEYFEIIITIYK